MQNRINIEAQAAIPTKPVFKVDPWLVRGNLTGNQFPDGYKTSHR
jgi:hypothetical protein